MAQSAADVHPSSTVPRGEPMTVTAADGYPLAVTRFGSGGGAGCLVVAGGTGVPQGFYRRFAQYAAARGWTVLTFDYRGIGGSAPRRLRGFEVDLRDWGRLDLQAVVDRAAADNPRVCLVGHSAGGHAFGLMTDPGPVRAALLLGTGSGWRGWMPRAERMRVQFLWNVVAPVLTRSTGYLAWSRLGMGEDLPLDVYRQWKTWCRYPRYFFDDPVDAESAWEAFGRIRVPVVAGNSTDDRWIPPAARDAFMAGYRNATVTTIDIDPVRFGLRRLGHMGYFRPGAEPIWDDVLTRLDALAP